MRKMLTGSALKIIAMASMLSDHLAIVLSLCGIPDSLYWAMRCFGRISFPIYCFILVEGFVHTHSAGAYLGRFAAFAVLSEIPFDMAVFGTFFYPGYNNIFFNLTLTLAVLWALSKFFRMGVKGYFFSASLITAAMLAAHVLRFDYSWRCVLLTSVLYFTTYAPAAARYGMIAVRYVLGSVILIIDSSVIGLAAPAGFLPVHLYNGDKGKIPKYVFYIFYPAHLLVLGLVRMYVL